MKAAVDPAVLVRPELRRLAAYHLDLSPCRHKLDQNEAPFEPPARLKRQVAAQLLAAGWARYPDFHADALRRALGAFHGWPPEGILAGNGSNELLDVCLSALAAPGSEVLGSEPSFGLYRMMVLKAGGVPCFLPAERDLRLPLAALLAEVERQPRRPLLLCSPNNPTGDALPPAAVAELLSRLEGPLLLDNAYGEFSRHDYRPLLDRHPHLILLRTFSKAWALAGLRLGYLLADPRLVAELLKVKLPYNLGRAGILAALAALQEVPAARRRIAVVTARRPQWEQMLAAAGLRTVPSEANFLLVRCGAPAAARALRDGLAARGIRVRDVGAYPGLAGCLRISIGSGAALRATRRALAEMAAAGELAAAAEPAPVEAAAAEPAAVEAATAEPGPTKLMSAGRVSTPAAGSAEPAAATGPGAAAAGSGERPAAGAEQVGAKQGLDGGPTAPTAGGETGRPAEQALAGGPAAPAAAAADGRRGECERSTGETRVRLALALDGGGRRVEVGNGFFGHMLEALATHGGFGLEVSAAGDLHVDLHHTVEDVGIAFGEALAAALGERRGVARFGSAFAPLDEALARAVVDLSGRGFFVYGAPRDLAASWVTADFPLTLVADFFQAVADRGRLTLHLEILAARSGHHAAEAAFKAAALALRQAVSLRPGKSSGGVDLRRAPGGTSAAPGDDASGEPLAGVPSTKGTLTA
jgi:histidinol-phosphate aminotransferase